MARRRGTGGGEGPRVGRSPLWAERALAFPVSDD